MTVQEWLQSATRRLPSYDLAPKARTRYEGVTSARRAREQMMRRPDTAASFFPFATHSPHRAYRLHSGLEVSLDDRWAIIGYKGCGKTTLARQLMTGLARLYPMAARYTLDSKGDPPFDHDPNLVETAAPPPALGPGESLVWRPPDDDLDAYDAWLKSILKTRRPAIIYIDELSSLGKSSGQSFVPAYARLLKQGRSLHQSVITLTQEAAYIPRQVTNQLDHLVRMRLLDVYDASKLDRMAHGSKEPRREPLRPHGLWYRRLTSAGEAREFPDWRALLD